MPPAKLRFLAVPDFRAKGVAGARVAPMSVAAVQPGIDGKLSNARTLLLLDTAGKEFPSSGVSFREALETCVPPDAHPDPRDMAATENFMIEDEVDDLATAYDAAVVDADLLPLTLPPPSIRSNHDDVKSFLLSALERENATAGTGLRIADLDLVEAPIVSRASVFDDDSTLAAPTGARLALELEKHFRGDGGWLPTNSPSPPPRSELFAPLNPRDRDRAARASTEREMRAPFDARVRRALAAVDRSDFTPPTTPTDDDEQLDPLRELPVPVILQDTHAPTLASSEPVELLAARMGFKQVSVPRVDLTWPPDAVAAAEAAFDGGELEPVTQPAAPIASPPAWNLADTTRVMAADDVHVRPPAHVGSVVAALDAAGDAARALLERQERAADAMAEAADIEKAMRSDESFERASRELRVHSRAVLMGSGGGNNTKVGDVEGDADVTFFIRPGGLRPDCARSPADFLAPPPIQSPTAREANRLCKLVESPLCDPQPPRATRAGDGYGGYGGSHPVIDLTTQRIDRDAGANPIRVPPEISVEVIDDDDAALLDAVDHAARTARQIHTTEFKESDLDYVDDLAYPPVPIPRPRAARRSPPRSAFNPGRDVDEYPRVPGPARNPSPPPPRQAPDDAGWGGWEYWNGLGTRGDEGFNRDRPAPPSPPDRSPLRDFRLDDEFDEPMTDVRRMVSDWRTPTAAMSPPRRIDRGWGGNASAVPREERRRRRGSIDSFDFDRTFDHRRLNSRAPPPPTTMDPRGPDDRRFPSRRHRSVSPPGRRYGHDDRYDDRYELPAYPRSAARGPASFDPRDFGSGYGIEASGRDREPHDARYRGAGGGDAAWGTPEKLRGMGRRTREHGAGGFMGSRAEGESPFSRGGRGRSRAEGGFGFDDFGFGVASRGLVAGRRERARDKGLDEFMKMTGQFRYGA